MSRIEWTERTWNPVTGCSHMSPGCAHCYAEAMAHRLQHMGQPRYANGFQVTLQPDKLEEPERWARPSVVFVNSMSDVFHHAIPEAYIHQIFATMAATPRHTFQVLTKRSKRLVHLASALPWPSNVWMGVSVESQAYAHRIALLRQVPAAVRFLSCEPLLGPLTLDLRGIHWVIVGGESGLGARPMDAAWVRAIRDQCEVAAVPFFFKQWGGVRKGKAGRVLDGRTWDAMPGESPRVSQTPVL